MSTPAQVNWIVSILELSLSAVFLVIPCWYLLWKHRSQHHIITRACLLLLIPDLIQILDFIPVHSVDLYRGQLADDELCKASSFLIIACIVASNGGNICVAYVSKRSMELKGQKVDNRTIYLFGIVSWLVGLTLASYFLGMGYLGSHKDVYCCTKEITKWDIAGIVFACYAICITAMVYYYYKAYKQVKSIVMPQQRGAQNKQSSENERSTMSPVNRSINQPANQSTNQPATQPANRTTAMPQILEKSVDDIPEAIPTSKPKLVIYQSSESKNAWLIQPSHISSPSVSAIKSTPINQPVAAVCSPSASSIKQLTVASSLVSARAIQSQVSPSGTKSLKTAVSTPAHKTNKPVTNTATSASAALVRRGMLMVTIYYACWSLIAINAVLDMIGVERSIYTDIVGAWLAKLQPALDAAVMIYTITKVERNKQAVAARAINAITSQNGSERRNHK